MGRGELKSLDTLWFTPCYLGHYRRWEKYDQYRVLRIVVLWTADPVELSWRLSYWSWLRAGSSQTRSELAGASAAPRLGIVAFRMTLQKSAQYFLLPLTQPDLGQGLQQALPEAGFAGLLVQDRWSLQWPGKQGSCMVLCWSLAVSHTGCLHPWHRWS